MVRLASLNFPARQALFKVIEHAMNRLSPAVEQSRNRIEQTIECIWKQQMRREMRRRLALITMRTNVHAIKPLRAQAEMRISLRVKHYEIALSTNRSIVWDVYCREEVMP